MASTPAQIGNYSVLYMLASGGFSEVYVAIHEIINLQVAIKRVKKAEIKTDKDIEHIKREIDIMRSVSHHYIIELYEVVEDEESLNFVMELAANGSLASTIIPGQLAEEAQCKKIFSQIIKALGYLHTHMNILHRDIKAENVLIDENENIRIVDFGLSSHYAPGVQQTFCGSLIYAAPEIVSRHPYSGAADVWSCGVLLYYMTTGHYPFSDPNLPGLMNKIVSAGITFPPHLSINLRDLLSKLLTKDPDHRIPITEILQHPWITGKDHEEFISMKEKIEKFFSKTDKLCIDEKIINSLKELNVDTQQVIRSLRGNEMNTYSAMYKIIRRTKINEMGETFIRSGEVSRSYDLKAIIASPTSQIRGTLNMSSMNVPHSICRKVVRGGKTIKRNSVTPNSNLPPLKVNGSSLSKIDD